MNDTSPLTRRHEFVLYFDVTNGNPNGDPDAGNLPRLDPETSKGLVSDVALKRKIRNYVSLAREEAEGFRIFMAEGVVLNRQIDEAGPAVDISTEKDHGKRTLRRTRWMCEKYYDIRTFGAVMSTGTNAGQVRGPVQLTFATSVEPIMPLEISITRSSVTNERDVDKERTMGRKHIVPYGLYRAHGFVSAPLASHPAKGTGFSGSDLELLFQALESMFEHDRSAARGEMATRKLIVFRHDNALGSAHAHQLFDRVRTWRTHKGSIAEIGADATHNWPVARSYADYVVSVDRDNLPNGVEVIERI